MRTRSQSKQRKEEDPSSDLGTSSNSAAKSHDDEGSLAKISKEAVGKLLDRANSRKGKGRPWKDKNEKLPKTDGKTTKEHIKDFGLKGRVNEGAEQSMSKRVEAMEGSVHGDTNEMDWEEGYISLPEVEGYSHEHGRDVTVEFTDSPSSTQKKRPRRVSAEDKELAELVHKVHLLCLLARGRLVDNACNDPLIQASILSLLPSYLMKIMEIPRVKAHMLGSLVHWFHENFHIRSESIDRGSFHTNLAYALEAREGSHEEVVALSVALFRALNLRTRYVSILDVASLRPDADMAGTPVNNAPRFDTRINSFPNAIASSSNPIDSFETTEKHGALESHSGEPHKKENSTCRRNLLKDAPISIQSEDEMKPCSDYPSSKRKGDLEFELQMEMALSATATTSQETKEKVESCSSSPAPPLKKLKKANPSVSTNVSSSAVWSRKNGPPLYWAEVYCSLETLNGRWVHIDAANGVVDGEEKVEAAAAACRRPLKYVVAFAGNGAKDVTRRYCVQWYKIAPRRINSDWWDTVVAPLKELESCAYSGIDHMEAFQKKSSSDLLYKKSSEVLAPSGNPIKSFSSQDYHKTENLACGPSGMSLEDAELETRALTEPLPKNQQAYKNHHLYAIERWLTKHQVLHPKGPVLGYCSGHPVYPRSCVQIVQTKHRWLCEGLQVKANETPAKAVKRSKKNGNVQISDPNIPEDEDDETSQSQTTIELYGKWQLEPLQLPHAVNGIVPKNEWGRVDVWSEKCLPHGTVHLRLPRLIPVARRLDIDFAPAFVGFEFRNGRSFPVYEGIVVCTEFKDAIVQAYEEEEERREAEERKRNEAQALSRWFQLLSSIVTRQRLQSSYADSSYLQTPQNHSSIQNNNKERGQRNSSEGKMQSRKKLDQNDVQDDHVHEFPIENQSFDEESMVRTKRCPCGFSLQVEEL